MKVTLKKPHTHAGKDYKPGEQIDVDEARAKWLAELEVIDFPGGSVSPPLTTTGTQSAAPSGKE